MSEKHTTRRRYITGKLVQRPGDLMSAFLDSTTTLFCAVDDRGEFVVFNKACELITGFSYEEMQGRGFLSLFDPADHAMMKERWAMRSDRPESGEVDLPWIARNGARRVVRWFFTRFLDEQGRIEFYVCIGEDVTERKRAEEAAREGEARFNQIAENVAQVVYEVAADFSRVFFISNAFERVWGIPRAQVFENPLLWMSTVHPDDRESAAKATNQPRTEFQYDVQYRILRRDGETRWIHDRATIRRGEHGAVILGVAEDITQRKRAEQALRESESRFAALFAGTNAVMFLTDPETGRFVDANPACAKYYGYTLEQLRQMHVWDINTIDRETALAALARAKKGTGAHFDFKHRLASGEIRDVEVYSSPISVDGRVLLHTIVHDTSERKRAATALLASEELNRRILEAVPGGIVQVSLDGSIRAANSAAQKILGLSWDAMKQRYVNDWLPETINEDGSPCVAEDYPVVRCLKSGQAQPAKTIGVRQKGGSIHWAVFTAVPLKDPANGALTGSVVTFLDVTERILADQALKLSEARFRTLVEEATEAICIADGAGRNIEANSRACAMFGYSRDEFSKLSVADTVPPEDRALIGPRFAEMKKGIPQRWERELIRKDGSRFPVEISARFLPDGRLLAFMRDMTERRRAEEALRESESRFRQLADAAPVFIWLADAKGARTYFSRGWTEFTGRALDDEIGDGWLGGVHALDAQRVADMLAEAQLTRQDFSLEYRLRASDGEYRWVLDHGVARFSANGDFAGYIGSSLDITERKRAEEALRKSEQDYRLLMEQAGDGIFILDEKQHLIDVNSRGCEILGYTKTALIAMPLSELVLPDDRPRITMRIAQLNAGETVRIERELVRKNGSPLPVEISARMVGPNRYQAIVRDVTERKRAEHALRESQRRLTTLLSNLPGMAYRCLNDKDWTMEFISEGCRDLTGYSPAELNSGGTSYGLEIICEDDRERIWNEVQQALAEKRGFTLSYRITRKDGQERWVWEQGRGVYLESGELVALEGFVTDVTERRRAEEALLQSDQRYKAFIAQSSEGVWRFEFETPIDLETDIEAQVDAAQQGGILAECNDAMARMYGYERAEQIIGVRIKDLLDMSDPANRETFRAFARARYRITDMESHEIGRDGSHHYFYNNVIGIVEHNKIVRIWGTQREVTEQRSAARALSESEERYRRLSGATAEAILIHEQGRVLDSNQRAADMFGYTPEELRSLNAFVLATPETREKVISNVRAGSEIPYEAVGLRKDGSTFPGEITARNLELGGKKVRVVAIRDITERKRAEEALRREAGIVALMQRVAMAANESSSSADAIRMCIDEICAYTGWPMGHAYLVDAQRNELFPTDFWHLDQPEVLAEFKRMNMAMRFAPGVGLPGSVLRDRKPYWIEDVANDKQFPGGRTKTGLGITSSFAFPVLVGREVVAVLEFGSGQFAPANVQLLEIMGNIGTQLGRVVERERASELLEARVAERTAQLQQANRELSRRAIDLESINKELEAFSYSVSHDLRAPLRGIFGFSQALQEDFASKLGEDGGAVLERIKNASQRMGRLIDDLLGLSRVTRAEMVREPVDLSAMAAEICSELRRVYPDRKVDIKIQPGVKAVGDPRMLRILMQNLLDNAYKFTARKANVRIEFSTEQTEQGLAYTVSDNGAGFDMQYAQKLFGAFQRLHSMKEFEGTGIGLATVQRIVHRHGGRVRAKGALNEGASIQFTLGPAEI